METLECIYKRKSIRKFSDKKIEREKIAQLISAGMQAPSGKNGQPWKFYVIQNNKDLLKKVSALSIYDNFVKTADCLICVFLDKTQSYNYIKDVQAIGACIQNMLLTVTELELGACWIGEILNRDLFVKKLININHNLDLMAIITLGYPNETSVNQTIKKH